MADKKISQLTALSAANVASATDVLAIVDTSATETKKITAKDLIDGALNGGTANGVLYLNGSKIVTSGSGLVFDSSGNLGLGVTPSAWDAGFQVLENSGGSYSSGSNGAIRLLQNAYYGSSAYRYKFSSILASRYEMTSGAHQWYTAPSGTAGNAITFTQAMTLDASGNLLVGTTSANTGNVNGSIFFGGTDAGIVYLQRQTGTDQLRFYVGGNRLGYLNTASSTVTLGTANYPLAFATNDTERGRFTAGGKFLVGTTSNAFDGNLLVYQATATNDTISIWNAATSGDNQFIEFYTEGDGTGRGSIDYNRAGGLTRYNTTSDYRAKDVYGLLNDSGQTIDALKVYRGKMHGATMERPMLIAHEAQEVAPYAVTGEKDAVNEDGTPKFQQMDTSSLVPLLIAEIQSLRSRVAALEAK